MAEQLSDDSSAASSSDEMFNMVIPFSQGSTAAATSPEGSNGKRSDIDDAEDGERKQGNTQRAGKKRRHEQIAIESNVDANEKMEEKGASLVS